MMRARAAILLTMALAGAPGFGRADHPADRLPTHVLIERGADAWSGRLRALRFLPASGALGAPQPPDIWEAARLLDARLPEYRPIWTFRHGNALAREGAPLHWEALDPAQQRQLDGDDGQGRARLDYLRGGRRHETEPPRLRPRSAVLGAMRGSRIQRLGAPGFLLDARHADFRRQHARRAEMLYVGANDGMLHGFDALTGEERLAVIPDAALPAIAQRAAPGHPAPAPVCRRPFAADAWTGAQWRSVLACASGALAPGLFLVDVTDPARQAPAALLAYDATDDPAIGHLEDPIPIAPLADDRDAPARWFAFSGNGGGDPRRDSRLLLLALDLPHATPWQAGRTAFAITVPHAVSQGGLGAPAVALGAEGHAIFAYAGDALGQIWRFDLRGPPPWTRALGHNDTERRQPFFTARSRNGQIQRIIGPILLAATAGGPLLVFTAAEASGAATLYGVTDPGHEQRKLTRDKLTGRTAIALGHAVALRAEGRNEAAIGWRIDLPPDHAFDDLDSVSDGSLLLTTLDAAGRSRAWLLNPSTGLPVGQGERSGQVLASSPLITVQAEPPIVSADGNASQRILTRLWQALGDRLLAIETSAQTRKLGRLSWREVIDEGAR